jgi:hypothetical protein
VQVIENSDQEEVVRLGARIQELLRERERLARAIRGLLVCEAKFITQVRDESAPAFNDLKEARRDAQEALALIKKPAFPGEKEK